MAIISLPTREDFLKQLSSYPVAACSIIDGDTTCCTICTGDLVDAPVNDSGERAVLLHDSHAFGEECARDWLASQNTCPKCRTALFQAADDDNTDAAIDDVVPIAPTFDEEELEHLLWQAGQLSTRDPHTEAFSDREVMAIYWDIWNQWMYAIDDNADGSWEIEGPRSNGIARALHELLQVRYSWWRHSRAQLDLRITGDFTYPAGSWMPTERDLHRRVVVDFDGGLQSDVQLMDLTGNLLVLGFDESGSTAANVAGHPAVVGLVDNIDGLLQNLSGRKIKVAKLREKLRECVGDADVMESDGVDPRLSPGYTDISRYLLDEVVQRVLRKARENRSVGRARRV